MTSKKTPTNDGPRDTELQQKRAGAIAVSPEDQLEELPGVEDETDGGLDNEMEDEDENKDEDEDAERGAGRGKESGADGKE